MISWTKTETRTVERRFRLAVETMEGHNRDATPADIIAAIEADEGLREEVRKAVDVRGSGDWQFLIDSANGTIDRLKQRLAAAESDRDAWRERAEKAEKERDNYRETARAWTERARRIEKERDEARADVEKWKELREAECNLYAEAKACNARQAVTIARLERELAEEIERFEKYAFGRDAGDLLELRARRKLDEWEQANWADRRIGWFNGVLRATAFVDTDVYTAPSHVELARKLGLI